MAAKAEVERRGLTSSGCGRGCGANWLRAKIDAGLPSVADLVGSDPGFAGPHTAAEHVRNLRG